MPAMETGMIDTRINAMFALAAIATLTLGALVPSAPALAQGSLMSDDDDDDSHPCMTSNRMRQFLSAKGYSDIKLNSPVGTTWQASASKGSQSYLVWVDTCSSRILRTSKRGAV
jgi:hypothetical protein